MIVKPKSERETERDRERALDNFESDRRTDNGLTFDFLELMSGPIALHWLSSYK